MFTSDKDIRKTSLKVLNPVSLRIIKTRIITLWFI